MRTRALVLASAVSLLAITAAGLPPASADKVAPTATTTRYLVRTTSAPKTDSPVVKTVRRSGGSVEHVYSKVFNGFSAELTPDQVKTLRADPKVEAVVPDGVAHATADQLNPTWGLDRIDQRATKGTKYYRYGTSGAGVTVYVVDTGVRLTHTQFGGRATSGYDFVDYDSNASDCNGHGTHVAGTIGGATYGVAKSVKIVSVRVLDCEGSGYWSDIIAGLDWVVAHKASGPAVINMSLGGGYQEDVDAAVARTVAAGIPVVVAAGNSDDDAYYYSPSGEPSAITVAATDSADHRSFFSNYGSSVDLFAPGEDVRSASNSSNTGSEVMSGTSMASPHVVGVVARYLQTHPKSTPAQTTAAVLAATTPRAVKDPAGSPNRLAYAAPPKAVAPGLSTQVAATKNDKKKTGTLKWSAPVNDGGAAITGYRVTRDGKSSTGQGPVTIAVSATTKSYTFTKLKKGSAYTLSVRAVNSAGVGGSVAKKITKLK
ncbi:MAG: S8 family serine peptidase [Propionibacteriaceae bacterium]